MPGRYTPLYSTIWTDPDFVALEPEAQRVYLLVISQPDISWAGVVPYTPTRWARMSYATTAREIEDAVSLLIDARFVVVDRTTEELMVRTFVANGKVYEQKQLRNALRRAFEAILSPGLKRSFHAEQIDEVKALVGSPPPGSPEIPTSLAEGCRGATGTKDLDLDLDLHPQPTPEEAGSERSADPTAAAPDAPGRPAQAHDLLAPGREPSLTVEVDAIVMALVDAHGAAKVDTAVQQLVDDRRKFPWPSDARKALETILGPAPKEAAATVLDSTQRAGARLADEGVAYTKSIADLPVDPQAAERMRSLHETLRGERKAVQG